MGNASSNSNSPRDNKDVSVPRIPSLDLFHGCVIGQALGGMQGGGERGKGKEGGGGGGRGEKEGRSTRSNTL